MPNETCAHSSASIVNLKWLCFWFACHQHTYFRWFGGLYACFIYSCECINVIQLILFRYSFDIVRWLFLFWIFFLLRFTLDSWQHGEEREKGVEENELSILFCPLHYSLSPIKIDMIFMPLCDVFFNSETNWIPLNRQTCYLCNINLKTLKISICNWWTLQFSPGIVQMLIAFCS